MYALTLTKSERDAFDWVGYRYNSGDIMRILRSCTAYYNQDDSIKEDDMEDLNFLVPEHKAWEIKELAEQEEYSFPCFADELKAKMWEFCDKII